MINCRIIIFLFANIMLIISELNSQNLIPNPSFEDYKKKKKWIININNLKGWYNPNKASPNVFSKYSGNPAFTWPNNGFGSQYPHKGDTYAGLAIYRGLEYEGRDFREYIEVKLSSKLIANHIYCLSIYISLADTCKYAAIVSAYFSNTLLKKPSMGPIYIQTSREKLGGEVITDKKDWKHICNEYIAKGGEQYLTLGNFKNDYQTEFIEVSKKKSDKNGDFSLAYYYIDDISLIEISDSLECNCQTKKKEDEKITVFQPLDSASLIKPEKGMGFVLNNIYFETDKYELLPESFPELNKLVQYLNKYPELKIEISGHTDSTGTVKSNLLLSENRAKSVVTYLISNGIDATRLKYVGYGSSKPLDTNETEEGRSRNRRVEILIIENKN